MLYQCVFNIKQISQLSLIRRLARHLLVKPKLYNLQKKQSFVITNKVKNRVTITVQKTLQQECYKMKKLNHASL